MAGLVSKDPLCVRLRDADGEVRLYALPYAEPALVRDAYGVEPAGHEAALATQLDAIRAVHPAGVRSVVVGHAFVVGGSASESEPLSVGGSGAVAASVFDGFDTVALGHLHRPQTLGERIHYAGSLLKYSVSEAGHAKSVSLIELDARGGVRIEPIALRRGATCACCRARWPSWWPGRRPIRGGTTTSMPC